MLLLDENSRGNYQQNANRNPVLSSYYKSQRIYKILLRTFLMPYLHNQWQIFTVKITGQKMDGRERHGDSFYHEAIV